METYKGAVCSYREKGRDTRFRGQDLNHFYKYVVDF